MSYASQSELTTRYGARELVQVTDKTTPPSGSADATTIARACTDADGEIESRLGVRYVVPIAPTVPTVVVDIACRIARYKLHEDRATPKIRTDYEDAIKFLSDVAAGRANIPGLVDSTGSPTTPDDVSVGRFAVSAPPMRITSCVMDLMP